MSPFRPVLHRLGGLAVASLLLLATGCSGSVSIGSPPTVAASDVEDQVVKSFTDQGGSNVAVECPADLAGKVGATMDCNATDDNGMTLATVTVTTIEGTDVNFDIDPTPIVAADDVAQQAATQLAEQVGEAVPEMTCPDSLLARAGESLVCTLVLDSGNYDTTVTVKDDQGNWDIQVADAPS